MRSTDQQWFGVYDRYSINRFRPLLLCVEGMLCFVGMLFWIFSWSGVSQIDPWTYGLVAFDVPAKFWAALIMGGSAMCVIGLLKPVKRWMITVGALVLSFVYAAITYSAVTSGGDISVAMFGSNLFLSFHLWIVWESVRGE